jgi:Flp pilus assembly pilin Flp
VNNRTPLAQKRVADCLKGQARLCKRIASECWNEETASKFERLAQECNDAAAARDLAKQFWRDESGSGAIEYGVIVMAFSLVLIAAANGIGGVAAIKLAAAGLISFAGVQ